MRTYKKQKTEITCLCNSHILNLNRYRAIYEKKDHCVKSHLMKDLSCTHTNTHTRIHIHTNIQRIRRSTRGWKRKKAMHDFEIFSSFFVDVQLFGEHRGEIMRSNLRKTNAAAWLKVCEHGTHTKKKAHTHTNPDLINEYEFSLRLCVLRLCACFCVIRFGVSQYIVILNATSKCTIRLRGTLYCMRVVFCSC